MGLWDVADNPCDAKVSRHYGLNAPLRQPSAKASTSPIRSVQAGPRRICPGLPQALGSGVVGDAGCGSRVRDSSIDPREDGSRCGSHPHGVHGPNPSPHGHKVSVRPRPFPGRRATRAPKFHGRRLTVARQGQSCNGDYESALPFRLPSRYSCVNEPLYAVYGRLFQTWAEGCALSTRSQ